VNTHRPPHPGPHQQAHVHRDIHQPPIDPAVIQRWQRDGHLSTGDVQTILATDTLAAFVARLRTQPRTIEAMP
jgi:hypothetical protein